MQFFVLQRGFHFNVVESLLLGENITGFNLEARLLLLNCINQCSMQNSMEYIRIRQYLFSIYSFVFFVVILIDTGCSRRLRLTQFSNYQTSNIKDVFFFLSPNCIQLLKDKEKRLYCLCVILLDTIYFLFIDSKQFAAEMYLSDFEFELPQK